MFFNVLLKNQMSRAKGAPSTVKGQIQQNAQQIDEQNSGHMSHYHIHRSLSIVKHVHESIV